MDAANNIADNTVEAFNKAIKEGVDAGFGNFNPVIRPVLDTTDLERSLSQIRRVDIPVGVSGIGAHSETEHHSTPVENMRPSVSFTQNNYSPEALSEADIYRQTKNIVSRLDYI